jgi:putative membrane protein
VFVIVAAVPTLLWTVAGWRWLTVPWVPVALIGTAVAFLTGFKNNASYGRLWEARKVWGAIVNTSRIWAIMVMDFISETEAPSAKGDSRSLRERLIHRHIAWLTALRHQLRQPRAWENMQQPHNAAYRARARYKVPEWEAKLEDELAALLDPAEVSYVLAKKNPATHLIALQSRELRELAETGALSEFRHVEMERTLAELYNEQGASERIKNFPYPRQFATLNLFFIWLFIVLVPLGLLQEFAKFHDSLVWLTVPASVIVSWVFHTMEKIGESSENPFEGSANDVPITAMSRTIEIDLREMLEEGAIPPAVQPVNNVLM